MEKRVHLRGLVPQCGVELGAVLDLQAAGARFEIDAETLEPVDRTGESADCSEGHRAHLAAPRLNLAVVGQDRGRHRALAVAGNLRRGLQVLLHVVELRDEVLDLRPHRFRIRSDLDRLRRLARDRDAETGDAQGRLVERVARAGERSAAVQREERILAPHQRAAGRESERAEQTAGGFVDGDADIPGGIVSERHAIVGRIVARRHARRRLGDLREQAGEGVGVDVVVEADAVDRKRAVAGTVDRRDRGAEIRIGQGRGRLDRAERAGAGRGVGAVVRQLERAEKITRVVGRAEDHLARAGERHLVLHGIVGRRDRVARGRRDRVEHGVE